jgi:hypothetical protein
MFIKYFIYSFVIGFPIFFLFFLLRREFIVKYPNTTDKINGILGSIFIWGLMSSIFGWFGFLLIGFIFTVSFISKTFNV